MASKHQQAAVATPAYCHDEAQIARWNNLLIVQLCNLSVRVWFGVLENLTVDVLLGPSFIDRYIHGILPSTRKVVPWHSAPVPILAHNQAAEIPHHISEEDWEKTYVATIRLARITMVAPHSRIYVPFNSLTTGLFQLDPTLLGPNFKILLVLRDRGEFSRTCNRIVVFTRLEARWLIASYLL